MIPITEEIFLSKDKSQWIVMKRTAKKGEKKKDGGIHEEDTFVNDGFFYSLIQVAKYAVNRMEGVDVESIEELTEAYTKLAETINSYLVEETKYEEGKVN
jgi:hypothetical protein